MRKCCHRCFEDIQIKNLIENRTNEQGTCGFCGNEQTPIIDPINLQEEFEQLLSIYIESDLDHGKTIGEWLKDDWDLFPNFEQPAIKDLLSETLGDGNIPRKNFVLSELCVSSSLNQWEELRKELMEENRFFPKSGDLRKTIGGLLAQLEYIDDLPDRWFRARIQEGDTPYTIAEMGPPPKNKASHGRANPVGIPYLYMASTVATATAEVRPHNGEKVSVSELTINEPVRLIDLRSPRRRISPFVYDDTSRIAALRADIEFLVRLGDELTRPVLPRSAAIDYIPSQYLCELIKTEGYDGVVYKSSMHREINIALFYPAKATAITVTSFKVDEVNLVCSELPSV